MSDKPYDAPNGGLAEILLAEHRSLRQTMDQKAGVEAAFVVTLVATALVLGFLALRFPANQVAILYIGSLTCNALAWSIEVQYWSVLWHQAYLGGILSPSVRRIAAVPELEDALLGFERFTRRHDLRSGLLQALLVIGSAGYQLLILLPAFALWAIAALSPAAAFDWPLRLIRGADIGLWLLLFVCVVLGYVAANFTVVSVAGDDRPDGND